MPFVLLERKDLVIRRTLQLVFHTFVGFMCGWKVNLSCCYGNRFVVIDAMLPLMPLTMLLSMPVVMSVVLPLALDSVSCMRKRYPFISTRAIERDRSSVVMFTAHVAVGNGVGNGVANCVVNRVLMPLLMMRAVLQVMSLMLPLSMQCNAAHSSADVKFSFLRFAFEW